MGSHGRFAFILSFVMLATGHVAHGAIINASGNVHATATANDGVATNSSNPPDTNLTPPNTSASNSASALRQDPSGFGVLLKANANVNATVNALTSINITGDLSCDAFMSGPGGGASVLASGNVAFTETTSETLTLSKIVPQFSLTFTDSLALKNASNATILSGPGSVAVTAGTYTLEWSFATTVTGNASPTSLAFSNVSYSLVPEPAALASLAPLLAAARGVRRRRKQ